MAKITEEERKELFRLGKIKGDEFNDFLLEVALENKEYFDKRGFKQQMDYCFTTIHNTHDPYYHLRYHIGTNLDNLIKATVVNKYKEIFQSTADYKELG